MHNYNMSSMKLSLAVLSLLALLIIAPFASATTTMSFAPGTYIIDMSGFPYTQANGLKPYGLIYDLVINKQIPVCWAIDPAKTTQNGIDFTATTALGTKNYRGGSFIIKPEYVTSALTTINTWKAQGVVVDGPTTVTFSASIYNNITSFPNAVCDLQNGAIIIKAFYTPSGVPASSYRLGSPQDLKLCDDIYAMPHADPYKWTTAQKTAFTNFINGGGSLWAACHAVSAMEADAPTYLGYDFLSQNGLIPWGSHAGPVLPYAYDPASARHPIMQFVGKLDNALQSGSEKVYIPDTTPANNNWRTTTTVAVYDPTQPNVYPSRPLVKAALVAFGYAYGDTSKGFVTYEASHSISTGNISENVDAARVYGNFLLYSGLLRRPEISASIPTTILSGQTVQVSGSVINGTSPYTYAWSSACGGTFASGNAASTTFTAPTFISPTSCILTLTVKDACNRKNFFTKVVTILPRIITLSKTDFKTVTQPGSINNYSINYTNTGTVSATNVTLVDLLPQKLTYISSYPAPASVAPQINGTTIITWNIGTVPGPSGLRRILLNASVKDTVIVGDIITNNIALSYWANGMGPITITALDNDNVVPVTKTVDKATAVVGNLLNYTIRPAYDGTKLLLNARVEDVLPPNTINQANINASGVYSAGNNTIRWNLGSNQPRVNGNITSNSSITRLVIPASMDNWLEFKAPDTNHGTTSPLSSRNHSGNEQDRPIIRFSLPSLPTNAVIVNATLRINVSQATAVTEYQTERIFRLLQNWTETGSNWNDNNTAVAGLWTVAGGYFSSVLFGTFSTSTTGKKYADLTTLVTGWYDSNPVTRYPNYGILLSVLAHSGGGEGTFPQIYSREAVSSLGPALMMNYTLQSQRGTISLWAHPLLTCQSGQIKINMTVNAMQSMLVTPPATLTVTSTNGATATYVSGPSPASATIPANTSYNFTYVYNINPGTNPGSITFTGKPTSTGYSFTNGISNSVLVTPALTYRVQINPATPNSVNAILNDAMFKDSNAIPGGVISTPPTQTNLFWPASISTAKNVNVSVGSPSTMMNFSITVTNTNVARLDPVLVVDTLPAGLEYITSGNGSANMNVITWSNIGPLASGQSKTLWMVGHLDGKAYGFMNNIVNVTGTTIDSRTVRANASQPVQSLTTGLAVTKSSSVAQGPPSTNVVFTLNVTNTGQATLNPVRVQDFMVDGLDYVSSNASSYDLTNNTLTWDNIGPLTGGQKKSLTVNAHISGTYFGDLYNTVVATGKPPAGGNITVLNYTVVYAQHPIIQVIKTVNLTEGAPSTKVNFTINVSNPGEVALSPVKVVDTLPAGLAYVTSTPVATSVIGNTITWDNIGSLNVGQSRQVYIAAHINGNVFGNLTNIVNVTGTSSTSLKYYANDTRNVKALRASIVVNKTVDLPQGAPSTNLNFTLNVTNTGEVIMNPVEVVDRLPYGLNIVSSGNGTAVGNNVTWANIGPLTPGQIKNLHLLAHINGSAYGVLTNIVNVTGTSPTGLNYLANDTRKVTALRASLWINKTYNLTEAYPHEFVNITINATNTGEVTLNPVTMFDLVPNRAFDVFYVSSNGTYNGISVIWNNIGPLTPGQRKQMFLIVQTSGLLYGTITNTIFGTGRPPTGDIVLNQSTANMTILAGRSGITLRKIASPDKARYLENITFTINVTNIGNVSLDPVAVIDTLPIGLTYNGTDLNATIVHKTIIYDNIGPMASNQSKDIHVYTFVDGDYFGLVNNTVTVIGHPQVGNDVIDARTAIVETLTPNSNVSISKTATPKTAGPGDNVTFIINATNTGDISLHTVRVVDVLPAMMVYESDNRSGSASGNVITWDNVGPLDVNQSTYISLNATVTV
jgi:uncharacterized repeat protein (TIGR01451 family)